MRINYLRKTRMPIPDCLRPWLPDSEYHPTLRLGISYSKENLGGEPKMTGVIDVFLNHRRKGYEQVHREKMDFETEGHEQLVTKAKEVVSDENLLIQEIGKYLNVCGKLAPSQIRA